jgi:hypothetical protein
MQEAADHCSGRGDLHSINPLMQLQIHHEKHHHQQYHAQDDDDDDDDDDGSANAIANYNANHVQGDLSHTIIMSHDRPIPVPNINIEHSIRASSILYSQYDQTHQLNADNAAADMNINGCDYEFNAGGGPVLMATNHNNNDSRSMLLRDPRMIAGCCAPLVQYDCAALGLASAIKDQPPDYISAAISSHDAGMIKAQYVGDHVEESADHRLNRSMTQSKVCK